MLGVLPYWNPLKGGEAKPVLSDERGLLTQNIAGKWYHLAKQGRIFSGSAAAAGAVLPIFSNTAQVFGIFNPPQSGVIVSLISVVASYVDTTGAAGGFVLGINEGITGTGVTGAISAFTHVDPKPAIVGVGGGSRVRFTPSGATTVAPTIWRHLGINHLVMTAAEDEQTAFVYRADFDGEAGFGPGNAVWLAGNIATASKWAATITWAELPL